MLIGLMFLIKKVSPWSAEEKKIKLKFIFKLCRLEKIFDEWEIFFNDVSEVSHVRW